MSIISGIWGFFFKPWSSAVESERNEGRAKSDGDTEKLTVDGIRESRANIQLAVANDTALSSILHAIVINVVGRTINVQSRVKKSASKDYEKINEEIEAMLEIAKEADNFDVKGRLHFNAFFRAVIRFYFQDGGVIIRKHINKDWWLPIRFELVAVSMIDINNNNPNDNTVNGIKTDKYGKISHIALFDNVDRKKSTLVAMEELIYFSHIWVSPSQYTAVSMLLPAYKSADKMSEYEDAEVESVKNKANAGVYWATKLYDPVMKAFNSFRGASDATTEAQASTDAMNKISKTGIKKKGTTAIPVDDKIYTVDHKSDTVYDSLVNNIKKSLASAVGLGQQVAFRDVEKTSYSSAKYNNGLDNTAFSIIFDDLQELVLVPVLRAIVANAVKGNILTYKDFNSNPRKYQQFDILRTVYNNIEPLKTASANEKDLKNGLKTKKQILGESGKDWKEVVDDTLDVEEYEREQREKRGLAVEVEEKQVEPKQKKENKDA